MEKLIRATNKSWGMRNNPLKKIPTKKREEIDNPFPDRKYSELDFHYLSYGSVPEAMEDKWFTYMDENNILRNYRSWTNFLIDEFYFEKREDGFYHIKKSIHNTDPKQSGPYSSWLIQLIIDYNKCRINLCSHCFKEVEKNERTVMEYGIGIKKKGDKKMSKYRNFYHHFCHLEKHPEVKLHESIH